VAKNGLKSGAKGAEKRGGGWGGMGGVGWGGGVGGRAHTQKPIQNGIY